MIIKTTLFIQFTEFLGKEMSHAKVMQLAKQMEGSRIVKTHKGAFWSLNPESVWQVLSNHRIYGRVLRRRNINSLDVLYERTMQYLGERDGVIAIRNKAWRMASYNPNFYSDED